MKLRVRFALFASITLVLWTSPAVAHLFFNVEGVHFKDPAIDFGAPPSRYALFPSGDSMGPGGADEAWRPGTTYLVDDVNQNIVNDVQADSTRLERKATGLEAAGQYRQALSAWRWGWNHGVGDPSFERERIALLTVLTRNPHEKGAQELLSATAAVHPTRKIPDVSAVGPALQPFALYRKIDASPGDPLTTSKALWRLYQLYPHSPMTEAALISIPRHLLASRDSAPADVQLSLSRQAMATLASQFPHSRFLSHIEGWRGQIETFSNNYAQALQHYRRQLAIALTVDEKKKALDSIALCEEELSHRFNAAIARLQIYGVSPERYLRMQGATSLGLTLENFSGVDARRFWNRIADDPRLLSIYLDYRVEIGHPTVEILSLFKNRGQKAMHSAYRGHFLARLAQASYRLKRYDQAAAFASRSLRSHPAASDQAMDHYLLGSVAKKSGNYAQAQVRYERILRRFPQDYLCGGARENLALLYERKGRMGDALDLYRKLKYDFDVAYLLDVRMTPSQVAAYVSSHRRDPQASLLRYSLGMRYLRADRFVEGERVFASMSEKQRRSLDEIYYRVDRDRSDPPDRIQDPLKTCRDLRHLYRVYQRAVGNESKAEALTQIADYYYDKRDLLLYNPALWHQCREVTMAFSWNPLVASRQDDLALRKHHWDHECLARTYVLCEKIRTRFPKSSVRFRVAYREACAAEHLSNFNEYWRWEAHRSHLIDRSVELMKVAMRSPDKELAAKARKYKWVFADQRSQKQQAFQDDLKSRKDRKSHGFGDAEWMPGYSL